MKLIFRGVFNPPGYIHIHNNQFKELPFHVTPQINDSVTGFGYQSQCTRAGWNALTIRMRKPSKHLGGTALFFEARDIPAENRFFPGNPVILLFTICDSNF